MSAELKIVTGEFVRTKSTCRNWITKDGRAGPTGESGFIGLRFPMAYQVDGHPER